MNLFLVRDRDDSLHLCSSNRLVKNQKQGYWLPEYDSGNKMMDVNKDEFPNVRWDDSSPTRVTVSGPSYENNNSDVHVPGTIEIDVKSKDDLHCLPSVEKHTVFIDDISFIEPNVNDRTTSFIHMKNGARILCNQSQNEVKQLICDSHEFTS